MKILLIGNSSDYALIGSTLNAPHEEIAQVDDGQMGIDQALTGQYDLILLNTHLPHGDGISVCRHLRSLGYDKPILILTAQEGDGEAIAGFEAGATDYLTLPWVPEVCLAKIQTILRRHHALIPPRAGEKAASPLQWGELVFDRVSGRVTVGSCQIPLTATEYNLLELFLRNPNRIFSRSAILDRLWGLKDAPTDRAIVTHVKDIRKKLKAGGLTDDLIETIYGMGYRLKAPPARAAEPQTTDPILPTPPSLNARRAAMHRVLERFRGTFNDQIAVLEQARIALLAGWLAPELQLAARQEAHKLAGSLASFGYPEGSRVARLIEHQLINPPPLAPETIAQVAELVLALQQELAKPSRLPPVQPLSTPVNQQVLVIDDDVALVEQLQVEAPAWGIQLTIASNPGEARSYLARSYPDAILLDLSFPDPEDDGLLLLRELMERSPHLPVIVFTGRNTFSDRLAASRLGARQFLPKPVTTETIFQVLAQILTSHSPSAGQVMILDDDPAILHEVSQVLTPWGFQVIPLSAPERFWDVFLEITPDLLILDVAMPSFSGIELCQTVRNDPYWGTVPILFLTAYNDTTTLVQAFAAGGDDYIRKPVLAPELIARVLNRLEPEQIRRRELISTLMRATPEPGKPIL